MISIKEKVRELGDRIGYGRLMQEAHRIWNEKDPTGMAHTVGPSVGLMQPCKHQAFDDQVGCDICCGSGLVTNWVAQKAAQSDGDPVRTTKFLERYLAEYKSAYKKLLGELQATKEARWSLTKPYISLLNLELTAKIVPTDETELLRIALDEPSLFTEKLHGYAPEDISAVEVIRMAIMGRLMRCNEVNVIIEEIEDEAFQNVGIEDLIKMAEYAVTNLASVRRDDTWGQRVAAEASLKQYKAEQSLTNLDYLLADLEPLQQGLEAYGSANDAGHLHEIMLYAQKKKARFSN